MKKKLFLILVLVLTLLSCGDNFQQISNVNPITIYKVASYNDKLNVYYATGKYIPYKQYQNIDIPTAIIIFYDSIRKYEVGDTIKIDKNEKNKL